MLWSFDWSLLSSGFQPFFQSNPYGRAIIEQAGIQSGQADVPYTRQYVGTIPLFYQLQQMVEWGLSPIPGVVVVIGFLVGLWRAVRGKPAEILLMAGAIPYFATILTLETKWMRYMLPLVPIFCILGAAMLICGWVWYREYASQRPYLLNGKHFMLRAQRNLFPALTVLTVGAAFLWSVAFMNIYSQPHSRNQASYWIYDNVPQGSKVSMEAWDDALPLGVPPRNGEPGHNMGMFQGPVVFDIYPEKPPAEELNYLKTQIANTDYIIIASNRIYGSIRHLPWRYPVPIEFYDLLFNGKLGFEKVHTTRVTPSLFGINFDDQSADESFTVYDHPQVDVFKKITSLTDDEYQTLFSSALNRPGGTFSTARHDTVQDDNSLAYDQPVSSLGDVNDVSWNPLAQPNTQWLGVFLWLVLAELLGLIALPIMFTICRNLPDKGYPLAKLVGILLLAWGMWVAASVKLISFTVGGILVILLLLVGLSYLCWRMGAVNTAREFFATKRRLVIFYEVLFLVTFLAFVYIRMLNPDLWHSTLGGEKPMEVGFLNATLRSPWMPPVDPFFSGGYINYYYYGQFIMGVLIKLLGVYPALGVNLAIPLLYALTFTAGVSIVYNIVAWAQARRGSHHTVSRAAMFFGVIGGVLMLVIGNMYTPYQGLTMTFPGSRDALISFMRTIGLSEQSVMIPAPTWDFWGASRIISHTINEFPFWSFLFADFHPHLIDMPFTMLCVGLALNIAFSGMFTRRSPQKLTFWRKVANSLSWLWGEGWSGVLRFGVLAIALGTLFATNSWDFPTYAGVAVVAALVALMLSRVRQPMPLPPPRRSPQLSRQ